MIIDSHCHLDFPNLYSQLDDVIYRANSNDIQRLLTICTTIESFDKIKKIVNKYKNIYGTFGIHPHETKNNTNVNSDFIIDLIKKNKKIIGIGESGLDYYYYHSDKKIQKKSFMEHIEAASKLEIPIIVHSRNAETDTYELLKAAQSKKDLKILIHCFTGSSDFAKKLLDIGCYISVSGIITFNKSSDLNKTNSEKPLEKLLVETDSPYLAPSPHRGKSNEPSYLKHTVEKLALIKNTPFNKVVEMTTNNFIKIFKL